MSVCGESFIHHCRALRSIASSRRDNPYRYFFSTTATADGTAVRRELTALVQRTLRYVRSASAPHATLLEQLMTTLELLAEDSQEPLTASERALYVILHTSCLTEPFAVPPGHCPLDHQTLRLCEGSPRRPDWSTFIDPVVSAVMAAASSETLPSLAPFAPPGKQSRHGDDDDDDDNDNPAATAFVLECLGGGAAQPTYPGPRSAGKKRPHGGVSGSRTPPHERAVPAPGRSGLWDEQPRGATIFQAPDEPRRLNASLSATPADTPVKQRPAPSRSPSAAAGGAEAEPHGLRSYFHTITGAGPSRPAFLVHRDTMAVLNAALHHAAAGHTDPFGVLVAEKVPRRQYHTLRVAPDLLAGPQQPHWRLVAPIHNLCAVGNIASRIAALAESSEFLEHSAALGAIGMGALAGLRAALRAYRDDIRGADADAAAFQRDLSPAQYLANVQRLAVASEPLHVLADLFAVGTDADWRPLESLRHCTSAHFISLVYAEAVAAGHTSATAAHVRTAILHYALRPVLRMLADWVHTGHFSDVFSEFFVEQACDSAGADRFCVNTDAVRMPSCLTEDTAYDVLCAGLARRLLDTAVAILTVHAASDSLLLDVLRGFQRALRGEDSAVGTPPGPLDPPTAWARFFAACEATLTGEEMVLPSDADDDPLGDEVSAVEADAGASDAAYRTWVAPPSTAAMAASAVEARQREAEAEEVRRAANQAEAEALREDVRQQLMRDHEARVRAVQWQSARDLWKSRRQRLRVHRARAISSIVQDVHATLAGTQRPSDGRLTPVGQVVVPLHTAYSTVADNNQVDDAALAHSRSDSLSIPRLHTEAVGVVTYGGSDSDGDNELACETELVPMDSRSVGPSGVDERPTAMVERVPAAPAAPPSANDDDTPATDLMHDDTPSPVAVDALIVPHDATPSQPLRSAPTTTMAMPAPGSAPIKVYDINDAAFHELVGLRPTASREEAERNILSDFYRREEMLRDALRPGALLTADAAGEDKREHDPIYQRWMSVDTIPSLTPPLDSECAEQGPKSTVKGHLLETASSSPPSATANLAAASPPAPNWRPAPAAAPAGSKLSAVEVFHRLERFAPFVCRYYSQKAVQLLLLPDHGPLRQVFEALNNVLLLQAPLTADDLLSAWAVTTAGFPERARPQHSRGGAARYLREPFDANHAFSAYFRTFSKAWQTQPAAAWLPLSLSIGEDNAVPACTGPFELLPHINVQAPSMSGPKRAPAPHSSPVSMTVLGGGSSSPLLQGHYREVLQLLPPQAIERLGDVFVSLVFWRWVRELLCEIWRTASQKNLRGVAKEAWAFLVLARGVLLTVADFIWFRTQSESTRFMAMLLGGGGKHFALSFGAVDAVTHQTDLFLQRLFVATLLAPAFARARRQARTLVRIVEDVAEAVEAADCERISPAAFSDLLRAKERDFVIAADIFIRHVDGASSVLEGPEHDDDGHLSTVVKALRAALHTRHPTNAGTSTPASGHF